MPMQYAIFRKFSEKGKLNYSSGLYEKKSTAHRIAKQKEFQQGVRSSKLKYHKIVPYKSTKEGIAVIHSRLERM